MVEHLTCNFKVKISTLQSQWRIQNTNLLGTIHIKITNKKLKNKVEFMGQVETKSLWYVIIQKERFVPKWSNILEKVTRINLSNIIKFIFDWIYRSSFKLNCPSRADLAVKGGKGLILRHRLDFGWNTKAVPLKNYNRKLHQVSSLLWDKLDNLWVY